MEEITVQSLLEFVIPLLERYGIIAAFGVMFTVEIILGAVALIREVRR